MILGFCNQIALVDHEDPRGRTAPKIQNIPRQDAKSAKKKYFPVFRDLACFAPLREASLSDSAFENSTENFKYLG